MHIVALTKESGQRIIYIRYFNCLCASTTTHFVQVMSPTKRDDGAANQTAPDVVTDASNEAFDHHLKDKSLETMTAMN